MLGLRSWWVTATNREEWRKLLKEAKTLRVVLMMVGKVREISSSLITQKVGRTFGTVKGSLYWRLLP
jgi:hypothetical protein